MGDSFIYMHPVYIHVYLGVVGGWRGLQTWLRSSPGGIMMSFFHVY